MRPSVRAASRIACRVVPTPEARTTRSAVRHAPTLPASLPAVGRRRLRVGRRESPACGSGRPGEPARSAAPGCVPSRRCRRQDRAPRDAPSAATPTTATSPPTSRRAARATRRPRAAGPARRCRRRPASPAATPARRRRAAPASGRRGPRAPALAAQRETRAAPAAASGRGDRISARPAGWRRGRSGTAPRSGNAGSSRGWCEKASRGARADGETRAGQVGDAGDDRVGRGKQTEHQDRHAAPAAADLPGERRDPPACTTSEPATSSGPPAR